MQKLVGNLRRAALWAATWSVFTLAGCSPPVEAVDSTTGGASGGGKTGGAAGIGGGKPPERPPESAGTGGGEPVGGSNGTAGVSGGGGSGAQDPDAGPSDLPADGGRSMPPTHGGVDAARTEMGTLIPTGLQIQYRCAMGSTNPMTSVGLMMTVKNTDPIPIDLTTFKLRYWLTTDNAAMFAVKCEQIQAGQALNCAGASVKLVPVDPPKPGADSYIEVSFSKGGIGYTASVPITLRLNATAPGFVLGNDYSCYSAPGTKADNDRITAYVDGQLIWGKEP